MAPAPIHRDYTLQGLLARVQVQLQLWVHNISVKYFSPALPTRSPPPSRLPPPPPSLATSSWTISAGLVSHVFDPLSHRHFGYLVRPSSLPLIPHLPSAVFPDLFDSSLGHFIFMPCSLIADLPSTLILQTRDLQGILPRSHRPSG